MLAEIPSTFIIECRNLFKNANNIWKWLSMVDGTMSKKLCNHLNNTAIITEEKDFLKKGEDPEKKILLWWLEEGKGADLDSMPYKETCNLCKGNGYITIVVEEQDKIKQCWLCESKGEKEYSQAEVDDLIYKTYYKK